MQTNPFGPRVVVRSDGLEEAVEGNVSKLMVMSIRALYGSGKILARLLK